MGQTMTTDVEVAMREFNEPFRLGGHEAEIFVRDDGTLVVVDYDLRKHNLSGEVFFAAPGAWLWGAVTQRVPPRIPSTEELATRLVAYDERRASFHPAMAEA